MAAFAHPRPSPLEPHGASRRAGLVAAIALHAAIVAAFLTYEPSRTALMAAVPIMVEFITPPEPPEMRPAPQAPAELPKPKAKPVAKALQPPRPAPQPQAQPLITAPNEAPSPMVVAPPAAPAPAPVQAPVAAASTGAAGPASQGAITPPIFNAAYLENPPPAYPPVSRRMQEEGRVMLRVLVNPAGSADEVQVRTTSGIPRLDDAAVETVKRWKFVPAKRGNEPVAAWVLIPISFKLEG